MRVGVGERVYGGQLRCQLKTVLISTTNTTMTNTVLRAAVNVVAEAGKSLVLMTCATVRTSVFMVTLQLPVGIATVMAKKKTAITPERTTK